MADALTVIERFADEFQTLRNVTVAESYLPPTLRTTVRFQASALPDRGQPPLYRPANCIPRLCAVMEEHFANGEMAATRKPFTGRIRANSWAYPRPAERSPFA